MDEEFSTILMDGNTPIANNASHMFMEPFTMENSTILFPYNDIATYTQNEKPSSLNQEENYYYPPPFIYQQESARYHGMSANIVTAPAPSRTTRRGRPRNQGQAEQNMDVLRLSNKRPFHAVSYQSPSIWNYTPYHKARYHELTRPITSNVVSSSNMNMGLKSNTGSGALVEERIKSLSKFEGLNELSNRCVLPSNNFQSHKTNIIQDGITDEQRLKLMLSNLPTWTVPNSQVNSSMMTNGTLLNAHVGTDNLFGSNFNCGIQNQGSFFEYGSTSNFGIVNQNNLFGSDSSYGSRTVNQNNFSGSTTTISNQTNTNGMCINDNPPMSMLPMSYGCHYMQVSSIYRDWLKMGETTSTEKFLDVPKESSLVVENVGEEGEQKNNKGKEAMTLETNIEENGVFEGYNCGLLVPEETSNENKQESSTVPMPPSDESERFLDPLFWEDDEFDFTSIFTKNAMDTFFRDMET